MSRLICLLSQAAGITSLMLYQERGMEHMGVQTIYMACIIGGIGLLFSSIVLGAVGDFFDFAAVDVFSFDEIGRAHV